jgi:tRNA(Ile)-lysidine synthetase-like protein
MIQLLHKLPRTLTVAFSGGVDSVAVLDFLSKNHEVDAAFFHHGTDNSDNAFDFVWNFCRDRDITMTVGYIRNEKPKELSWEEHWRNERYAFLENFEYVITGHHLNDCIETYIWGTMHGTPKVIPDTRKNVHRPFLLNPKQEFIDWCNRKELNWCQDYSNENTDYMRNYIRKHVVEHAYHINPGIEKVVKKLILNASESE